MATDARSTVTIDLAVGTTNVAPELAKVKTGLDEVNQAAKEVNKTASEMTQNIPRSMAELAAQPTAAKNVWGLRVRGEEGGARQLKPLFKGYMEEAAPGLQEVATETKGMLGSIGDAVREVTANIKSFFSDAWNSVLAGVKRVGPQIANMLQGWGAFGIGFGVSALLDNAFRGMNELVKTVDNLKPVAQNLNVSVQQLQYLSQWAKESGVPVGTMTRSLQDMSKNLGALNAGMKGPGVKRLGEALGELGLSEEEIAGIKNIYDFLPELGQRLAAVEEPYKRNAIAAALLGGAWKQMLPLLMQGPEAMEAAKQTADKAGTISPTMEKAAEDWKKATEGFYTSLQALRMELGGALIPALKPGLEEMTKFIQENRETVVWGFEQIGKAIASVVTGLVDLMKVGKDFSEGDWWTAIQRMVRGSALTEAKPFAGWGDALKAAFEVEQFKEFGGKIGEAFKSLGQDAATWFVEGFKLIFEKLRELLKQIAELSGFGPLLPAVEKLAAFVASKTAAAAPAAPAALPAPSPGGVVVSPGGGPIAFEDLAGARGGPILGRPANGEVKVLIENKNPPAGQKVSATAAGQGVSTHVDTGMSMPWSAPPTYSGPWAPGMGG